MCGSCAGATLAAPQLPARSYQTLAVPLAGSGTVYVNVPQPQPLPAVAVTARPFPWGRIILAVVVLLVLTKGGK